MDKFSILIENFNTQSFLHIHFTPDKMIHSILFSYIVSLTGETVVDSIFAKSAFLYFSAKILIHSLWLEILAFLSRMSSMLWNLSGFGSTGSTVY